MVSGNFRSVSDSDRMQRRLINMRGGHYACDTSSAAQALRWLYVDGGAPAVDFPDGLVHRKSGTKPAARGFQNFSVVNPSSGY